MTAATTTPRPARQIDLRAAARIGLTTGVAAVFLGAIGMYVDFDGIEIVGGLGFGRVVFLGLLVAGATIASTPPPLIEGYLPAAPGRRNLIAGATAGAVGAAVLVALTAFIEAFDVREVFINLSPALIAFLRLGQAGGMGLAVLALVAVGAGVVGGAMHLVPVRPRRLVRAALLWIVVAAVLEDVIGQIFRQVGIGGLSGVLYGLDGLSPVGVLVWGALGVAFEALTGRRRALRGRIRAGFQGGRRRAFVLGTVALGLLALGALPQLLGQYLTAVANIAGVYLLMALGLNVVVGFAGLLDLGYVAFFAVGAYVTAVLTSPGAPGFAPELPFLVIVPLVLIAGAIAGVLVGTPVIRMRGDYLAIVTLGFGEIARLLAVSDWLKPILGGAQGINRIPNIAVGSYEVATPAAYFAAVYGLACVGAYVSIALQSSRVGRAWIALREDESVAEAMGVNIVTAKLWAFVLGAAFASLGGALYATNIHSIFPPSFGIEESILVLIVVIVGGIASVPGVALGAIVLIGLPELLREFEAYRYMVYGALLIYMMLRRPGGLIPSRRRVRELREDERLQDAWAKRQTEDPSTPEAYTQPREV